MKDTDVIEKKNQVLSTLEIVYVSATEITPNDYNPNRQSDHDFFLLVLSMTEDGFTQPIIAHRDTKQIVDGEHRWTCAIVSRFLKNSKIDPNVKKGKLAAELEKVRAAGLPDCPSSVKDGKELVGLIRKHRASIIDPGLKIPVVFVDMTPEQMRIATLRHNRARGSEDIELTAALLRDLRELGALDWAQDSLMLDETEMNRMLEDISAPQAMADANYGEAWQPSSSAEKDSQTKDSTVSMTPEAVEKVREQEKKIAAAKTEEERVAAAKDQDIYRLSLIFSGDEAVTVKAALGATPAATLLDMCKAKVAGA